VSESRSSGRYQPGSAAEEAAKLAEAARLWLAAKSVSPAGSDVWAEATAEETAVPPECTGCPICAARRRLGGLSPEAYGQLADALGQVAQVLRDVGKRR
jgi:hypothetical protein